MQISQDSFDGQFTIQAYQPGIITINDINYTNNLIISRNQLITHWAPASIAEITLTDLNLLAEMQPTLVILGTGQKPFFAKPEWLAFFYQKQIGVEVMDTGAACRTFMALAAEGRNVAAGLCLTP